MLTGKFQIISQKILKAFVMETNIFVKILKI